ncbi:MAG: 2-hydroxyacyl-CoA dehydratase subunit D [Myxococcota bacterium]
MPDAALQALQRLVDEPVPEPIRQAKADGRPVVGYFCQYIPPEIILAAGAIPLRLRGVGSDDPSLGDAYMSSRVCTFVRHVMSLVLDERYDVLDAAVCSNTCDHVRRAADVFTHKTDIPCAFVSVPRTPRESLFGYYLEELRTLYERLSEQFGRAADDEGLRQGIRQVEGNRRRLRALPALRRLHAPKLTGAESLDLHMAAQVLPPEEFQARMDDVLAELEARQGFGDLRARFVLLGAELDDPAYVRALESQGALVVGDQLCFGARSVLPPIDPAGPDPLEAIARAYFFRHSCARMMGDFPARFEAIVRLVRDTRADGVIFQRLVFCDPWGADLHNILNRSREARGFPVLSLSREYGIVPTGQLRTRVQAFVERIEIARAQAMPPQGGAS